MFLEIIIAARQCGIENRRFYKIDTLRPGQIHECSNDVLFTGRVQQRGKKW